MTLGSSDSTTISGQSTVTFTIGANNTSDGLSAAVSAINDFSSKTGVTAKVNSDASGVTLTNAAGQNLEIDDVGGVANAGDIVVKNGTGGAGSDQTLSAASGASTAGVATGQVTFESAKSFSVTGDSNETLAGTGGASTLNKVADLDVSTFDKSQLALAIVDGALSSVNSKRGEFGAVQSRFNSVINSLSATSENLSAARSRIRDTDFAAETAELTRTQILQQAGVSILSQANVLPQAALSLLG